MKTNPGRPSPSDPVETADGRAPYLPGQATEHGPGSRVDAVVRTARGCEEVHDVDGIREAYADPEARLWVDLTDAGPELVGQIASILELHPLIAEDIAERNQRAKIEVTGSTLHVVIFGLQYRGELLRTELDLVLGERFLLSSHEAAWNARAGTVGRVGVDRLLAGGPDYLLWAIVDSVVDAYLPVFDAVSDEIDTLEDDVIRNPSPWVLERLFQVKRDLLEIRHAVSPQREILNQLTTRDLDVVRPERVVYFRDVYDHLIRFTDELDSFRELVSTALDAYLSTVNNQLSTIMKRLTSITAILAGIGAVAGIFGMSEATAAFSRAEGPGFWIVTVAVILTGAVVWLYFRRIGWI